MWNHIYNILDLVLLVLILWIEWKDYNETKQNQDALRRYLDLRNKYYSSRTKQKASPEQRGLAEDAEAGIGGELVFVPVSGTPDGERPAIREAGTDSSQQDASVGDAAAYNQSIKP